AQPDQKFVVIFDDLKRASRDTRAFLDLRDAFRRRDVAIECLNFKFEETPEGEFIETIIAAQGALERKQNGRQVAQKMKARMENGYYVHTAPIGYCYKEIKGRGKMLFPNPPFDGIIREAFDGYANGRFQTQAEVKRFFESFPDFPRNKQGEVKQKRVVDILTQPVYTGHICSETYGIHWLPGQHEALISLETYEKVQERRAGVARAPKRKNIGDQFALRGIVTCAGCDTPLRSSFSKGRHGGRYPYYLCQTKTCDHYGKSIKRDTVEADIGELVKQLQPTKGLLTLATAMFRRAWDMRKDQAKDIVQSGKKQIATIDKQIDSLLARILDATNPTIIGTYEDKIAKLEKDKRLMAENLQKQAEPKGTFEEKLEPALQFLANPWKLWENGNITLRRTVLKLAFADRIPYCRIEGARTPKTAIPFKALAVYSGGGVLNGGA
ncbi:MAG: recombinase family protein, partial [Pseudomonadota bacterium]